MITLMEPPTFVVIVRTDNIKERLRSRSDRVHIRRPETEWTVCGRRFDRMATQTEPGPLCKICSINVRVPPVGQHPVYVSS